MTVHLSVDNVSKRFGRSSLSLDEVSCSFDRGMTGLLGPNGAGKTTLMRIIAGVLSPSAGCVRVDGVPIDDDRGRRALAAKLGFLPQDFRPYESLTAAEFMDYVGVLKGMTNTAARRTAGLRLLERTGLSDVAGRRLGEFSGGMRRRVGIAQALLGDPEVIVVDEPTAGLDPQERIRFRSLLATLGGSRTVVLSTHILDDVAQTCPFVCVMSGGRIVFTGATKDLVEQAEGRTWLLTAGPGMSLDGMAIANASATEDGTSYRIVGDHPPADAVAIPATIEDGYVALMNGVRQ